MVPVPALLNASRHKTRGHTAWWGALIGERLVEQPVAHFLLLAEVGYILDYKGHTAMTVFFIVLLGIGVIYAIFILIGAGLGEMHLPGADVQIGHTDIHIGADTHLGGEVKIPSLSPITIASFVTAFGAFGLIAQGLFNATAVWSLASAAVGGLIVAIIAHFAFGYFLLAPQGSSEVTAKDIVGATAEVVTPIPADSVGEIVLVAQGGRVTCPAKSAAGQPINRNTTVVVERIVGGIAFVRPQSEQGN